MPKIFYIGSFSKLWDEEGPAQALERLGCKVFRIEARGLEWERLRFQLVQKQPDLVIWAKLAIEPPILQNLIADEITANYRTACYMPDLYFGLYREWKVKYRDGMFKAAHVFSPDGGHDNLWKECNVEHHLLRQGIPIDYCYEAEPDPKYAYDIVFVGSLNIIYPYREKLVNWLQKTYGDRFKWFGKENSDEVRGHELNKLYASSKIVIGESVYSPNYWSNRIYETIGRGGFIIYPFVPGLDKEFKPYKHFIPYFHNDFESLREIIDHYLAHDAERKAIAHAGFLHTKDNHTLDHRMKELLNVLRLPHN